MNLKIRETFVNATKGHRFSEAGAYETFTEDRGELFRSLRREHGRCVSRVYVDTPKGAKPVGWVFQKRDSYSDDPHKTYLREVWVEICPAR